MPHGICYSWNYFLIGLHVSSDLVIVLSYYSIPIILTFIVVRSKGKIPFNWILLQFSIFIMACGTTHLMEIINIWKAEYWVAGFIKLVTAVSSIITAIALIPHVTQIISKLRALQITD